MISPLLTTTNFMSANRLVVTISKETTASDESLSKWWYRNYTFIKNFTRTTKGPLWSTGFESRLQQLILRAVKSKFKIIKNVCILIDEMWGNICIIDCIIFEHKRNEHYNVRNVLNGRTLKSTVGHSWHLAWY